MQDKERKRRVAVKVGSNVLTRPDGTLDATRLSALADQLTALRRAGLEVVLISSGAVASGRSELHLPPGAEQRMTPVEQRQLFSAVGQAKLIDRYFNLFREMGIPVGQVLTMREDFEREAQRQNLHTCMEAMLAHGVLPIVNENDTVCVTELMFTDNDELSGLIARLLEADTLVILTNVDGIHTDLPGRPGARLLTRVDPEADLSPYLSQTKSSAGRGGMQSKCKTAAEVARSGIHVRIANGRAEHILPRLLLQDEKPPHTHFIPHKTDKA